MIIKGISVSLCIIQRQHGEGEKKKSHKKKNTQKQSLRRSDGPISSYIQKTRNVAQEYSRDKPPCHAEAKRKTKDRRVTADVTPFFLKTFSLNRSYKPAKLKAAPPLFSLLPVATVQQQNLGRLGKHFR